MYCCTGGEKQQPEEEDSRQKEGVRGETVQRSVEENGRRKLEREEEQEEGERSTQVWRACKRKRAAEEL